MLIFLILVLFLILDLKFVSENDEFLSLKQTTTINGLFILFVFLSHISKYVKLSGVFDNIYLWFNSQLGQLMVAPFLFFSGYGIYYSIKNKNHYIHSFIKRRFIPTFVNFVFAVSLFLILALIMNSDITLKQIFFSYIGWDSLGNFNWYIFDILCLYILTFISFKVFKKNKESLFCLTFLTFVFIIIISYLKDDYWYNTIMCYPAGMYLYEYKDKLLDKMKNNLNLFITLFVLFLFFVGFKLLLHYNISPIINYNIESIIFVLIIVVLSVRVKFNCKLLYFFGKNIFWIYILQRLPMIVLHDYISNKYVFIVLCFIITILLSLLTSLILNKENVKMIIKKILYHLPIKSFIQNIILFESSPLLSDSTYFVYNELLRRNINSKYELIWVVNSSNEIKKLKDQSINAVKRKSIKFKMLNLFSKCIIDSNVFINKLNKHQYRIHLTHGTPVKMAPSYFKNIGYINTFVVLSKYWEKVCDKIFNGVNVIDEYKILGLPRDDMFFNPEKQLSFNMNNKYKKTILWMPTYRQHRTADNPEVNTNIILPYGVPCIDNDKEFNLLNKKLKDDNILLVIKPHPAQDLSIITKKDLSNIMIITNDYFKNGVNIYNYLPKVDALITDYSSVYYDFLLIDKPVGLAIPDLEEYTKIFKLPYKYEDTVVGEKIITNYDLLKFIDNICKGNDVMKAEREAAISKFHKYVDGNSTDRVVDYILEKLEEKY